MRRKILVIYYSWSGNTRAVANMMADAFGADLHEVELQHQYSAIYRECVDEYYSDKRTGNIREIVQSVVDFSTYDIIFVGTPNWSGTVAPPMRTFLTENSISGETVVPFVTHGGGGIEHVFSDMGHVK